MTHYQREGETTQEHDKGNVAVVTSTEISLQAGDQNIELMIKQPHNTDATNTITTQTTRENNAMQLQEQEEHQEEHRPQKERGIATRVSRQAARSVARHPCIYLSVSLLLSTTLAMIGMIVGNFAINANSMGWRSRGTFIADRHTQQMLTTFHQGQMLYGGDDVWDDLINNVQPGWETMLNGNNDDDDHRERRNLMEQEKPSSQQDNVDQFSVPNFERLLQANLSQNSSATTNTTNNFVGGCDVSYYKPSVILSDVRLWPIWKTTKPTNTILDPQVLLDICLAEESTQRILEEEGLCIPCNENSGDDNTNNKCLPPVSIVLYARLVIENGMDLSCHDLSEAWRPFQYPTERSWKNCIEQTKEQYDPKRMELPDECPFGFSPSLVDGTFDQTLLSHYTSSIFATRGKDIPSLYKLVDRLDRSDNQVVSGAYDTQRADFMNLYFDHVIVRDTVLGLLSAIIVSFAMIIHTKSPFLTVFGLIQIMMSFPLSFFFYKLVLGLNFFPFLNFMGVFIVFALGAGK